MTATVTAMLARIEEVLQECALPSRGAVVVQWVETHLGLHPDPWQRELLDRIFG